MEANAGTPPEGATAEAAEPDNAQPGSPAGSDSSPAVTPDSDFFFVVAPGSGIGSSVIQAQDEQHAANQFAATTGHSAPVDVEGNATGKVAVIKLDTVTIQPDEVAKITNPSG